MGSPVEIFVPCDVLAVKVRVGPGDCLSPLEMLFLRAVHAGVTHFHELADLFAIGHRPTLDLVFDLWKRGHLLVDLAQGAVGLPPAVVGVIADGRLAELAGGQATDEIREVMQDRLTGQILPLLKGGPAEGMGSAVVPDGDFDIGPHSITQADLLTALTRSMERQDNAGQARKVLGAHLSLTERDRTARRGWLRLTVESFVDEESDGLRIRLVEARNLPAAARVRALERLARLAEDMPESRFVGFLRDSADRTPPGPPPDVIVLLGQLQERVRGLGEGAHALSMHSDLIDLANRLEEAWAIREAAAAVMTPLVGHDAHQEAIARLAGEAGRQLVIVCPWMTLDAVQLLLPSLEAALVRRVQVFLLWGISREEGLPDNAATLLAGLRERFPHHFFFSRRGSKTHAKLAIRDDRELVVSSLNLLRPSARETLEVGVAVTAPGGSRCRSAESALEWAHKAYPEYGHAQLMFTNPDDFPSRPEASLLDWDALRPVPPAFEPDACAEGGDELHEVATGLWRLAWDDYAKSASRLAQAPRAAAARLLQDGDHRHLLWDALRNARHWLLIASDQLGPEVLDERFFRRLEERLRGGVFVALVYRRLTQAAGEGIDLRSRLDALRERHPERLRVIADAPTHAKLLVFDDIAVVSSFNFLSFEGYYGTGPAARRRQRSEIGVHLSGGDAADRILRVVRAAFPEALASWPELPHASAEPISPPAVPPAPSRAQQDLLRDLRQADTTRERAGILRAALAPPGARWWLLDRLEGAGLGQSHLRVGAAALLAETRPDDPPDARDRWLRWLAEDAWERGAFVEAAVLATANPTVASARMPRGPMALLGAAWATGQIEAVLEEVGYGDLNLVERVVLAGVALVEFLLRGSLSALQTVNDHEEALPAAWRGVRADAQRYWDQSYRPLPLETIRVQLQVGRDRESLEAAWAKLRAALAPLAGRNFDYSSGTLTRDRLYVSGQVLGQLEALSVARNVDALARLLRERKDELADRESLLDDATRAAGGALITGTRRQSFLGRLTSILEAAREVAVYARPGDGDDAEDRLTHAKVLARTIHQRWQALEQEAAAVAGPERLLLVRALADLREIAQWGNDDEPAA